MTLHNPGARRTIRIVVILTALLCLGLAGYEVQVWWAGRVARKVLPILHPFEDLPKGTTPVSCILGCIHDARRLPWYGRWYGFKHGPAVWMPKRTYSELLRLTTGQDFGENLDTWEAWLKAHPDLIWDEKLKRLVEGKPMVFPPAAKSSGRDLSHIPFGEGDGCQVPTTCVTLAIYPQPYFLEVLMDQTVGRESPRLRVGSTRRQLRQHPPSHTR